MWMPGSKSWNGKLVQLKQNQESALAAEMKGPSFKYSAGGGLTIAAADNNWSVTLKQRLQVYHTIWLSNENPEAGYQNLETRIRRFRPVIDVSSQQGFYKVTWLLNNGSDASTFGGDGFINFDKLNPWLPSFGWGGQSGLERSFAGRRFPYGRQPASGWLGHERRARRKFRAVLEEVAGYGYFRDH